VHFVSLTAACRYDEIVDVWNKNDVSHFSFTHKHFLIIILIIHKSQIAIKFSELLTFSFSYISHMFKDLTSGSKKYIFFCSIQIIQIFGSPTCRLRFSFLNSWFVLVYNKNFTTKMTRISKFRKLFTVFEFLYFLM
jgi:hypothetical protein